MDDEVGSVTCPECLHTQADMGVGVACEACGHWPMPHQDDECN